MARDGTGRLLLIAVLVRTGSAAAPVGVVVLAGSRGYPGPLLGALLALLVAPYAVGPVLASRLDGTARPGVPLAIAFAGQAAGLLLVSAGDSSVPGVGAAIAGCLAIGVAGPFVSGSLSSQLPLRGTASFGRRIDGLDTATYGIAATLGPLAVGVAFELSQTRTAMVTMAAASMGCAVGIWRMRRPGTERSADPASALAVVLGDPRLRRILSATAVSAIPAGALPLLAASVAESSPGTLSTTGMLMAALGVGHLASSSVLIARPLRGNPTSLLRRCAGLTSLLFASAAVATGSGLTPVVFVFLGGAQAASFAAGLAARNAYAPLSHRARVFTTMASTKVAAASVGSLLAGFVSDRPVQPVLLAAAGVQATAMVLLSVRSGRRG